LADRAQGTISRQELEALEELARHAGTNWRVCDDVLSCGTSGAYHLLADDARGATCTVAASTDVLDLDRARLVYLAAAANLAPALAAEVRRLRAPLA
jgi:hypothetical protein